MKIILPLNFILQYVSFSAVLKISSKAAADEPRAVKQLKTLHGDRIGPIVRLYNGQSFGSSKQKLH